MSRRLTMQLFAGLVCGPLLLATSQAQAGPFLAVVPPTCPTTTNIPWSYAVDGNTYVFDLPSDPNCSAFTGNPCPHYTNNLDHRRYFVANSWVGYVGFRLQSFQTEANYDFVYWGLEGHPLFSKSGSGVPGTILYVNTSASFGSLRALLNYKADSSVTYSGFNFNELQVCTYRSSIDPASPTTLDLKRRYHGVLLGTGDVVYLKFPAASKYHYSITLWRDAGASGTDYDLYARCGALPTPTQYDARSYSSDDQEFVDVANCSSTVYVAVHAYNATGAGYFHLARGIHSSLNHVQLRVGTSTVASSVAINGLSSTLREAARYFYGYTEGEQLVATYDIYNNGSCAAGSCGGANCDVCYHSVSGRPNSGLCSGQIQLYNDNDSRLMAHELGHLRFCAGDEYIDSAGPPPSTLDQCGHSVMANPQLDNHNICTPLDHNTDREPGAGPSALSSGWAQAIVAGRAVDFENTTYDNFPYNFVDFDNQVGTVITH